jgi:hypothetical protein
MRRGTGGLYFKVQEVKMEEFMKIGDQPFWTLDQPRKPRELLQMSEANLH